MWHESLAPAPNASATRFKQRKQDKDYYLLQSGQRYTLHLEHLPDSARATTRAEAVLIKLPSFTHNLNIGQHFVPLPSTQQKGKT